MSVCEDLQNKNFHTWTDIAIDVQALFRYRGETYQPVDKDSNLRPVGTFPARPRHLEIPVVDSPFYVVRPNPGEVISEKLCVYCLA